MFNFGGGATSAAGSSGGLFGSSSTATATASAAAPSGGLFGSSNTSAAPSGGLNTSAAPSGGLFGSSGTTTGASAAAPSGGLFGSSSTSAAAPSGGLFGSSSTSAAAPSGGLFGSSTTTTAAAPSGGLFGSNNTTSAAAPSGGLFGSNSTSAAAAPSGGLLGGSAFGASSAVAAPAAAIGRKTKFVDLPQEVQQLLEAIEKQKQVQTQIGQSIVASETEDAVTQITEQTAQLGQELAVVRMTLAGDQERIADARHQVNFAVGHAERACSLIAHATDNGTWAQSGLTPLQVANRQRTLRAAQADGDGSGGLRVDQLEPDQLDGAAEAGDGASRVDPFEAVRRIQFASMHHDVATEYYWDWLTRVESAAALLSERLDQLERHARASGGREEAADAAMRPSPRAVADVMQYQSDSFLSIAGKVAAVDDDIRRLSRRLGLTRAS
ncbi:hypothetical protein GGF46_005084 [Coemansia sp. RSA 552]|nr:hypothetical protein GGF46_005084 [Coemansia sp. RSA 552]